MNLSVCIITRNEADKLEKCLKSLEDYDIEKVVVDTGSKDNTIEVIEKYADVKGSFPWCNHFSKARNYAVSMAKNDWILVLDSDEWIKNMDIKSIACFINGNPDKIGRVERTNTFYEGNRKEKGTERVSRLFNRKVCEFKGRIHEQIVSVKDEALTYENVPIYIGHSGYDGTIEQRKKKAQRNIELLLLDLKETGDEPYTLYQLGKSYYMLQNYEQAGTYFERGLAFDLDPRLEYVQDMVETYGYVLLNMKRFEEMMFLVNIYDEFAFSADYIFLVGLAYMNNGKFSEAIEEFKKAVQYKSCKIEGCNSFKANYNIGVIYECLGKKSEAESYYRKCNNFQPALDGLKRLS